jgi:hypothetical protein
MAMLNEEEEKRYATDETIPKYPACGMPDPSAFYRMWFVPESFHSGKRRA